MISAEDIKTKTDKNRCCYRMRIFNSVISGCPVEDQLATLNYKTILRGKWMFRVNGIREDVEFTVQDNINIETSYYVLINFLPDGL